jgi:hypothetical protein
MSTPPDTRYNSNFEQNFDPGRAQEFQILKLLRMLHTATIVQVQAVTPISDSVGVVQVIPMIEDTTTGGVVVAQSPIYAVPYFRLQGGSSAVILDPVDGDIGLAVFAERDITGVIKTLSAGPAPDPRSHSSADGMYFGGFLNGPPMQWVKFLANAGGIDISTPGALTLEGETISLTAGTTATINAPGGLTINAPTTFTKSVNGTASASGSYNFASPIVAPDVIVPNGSVNLHVHPVTTAPGTTGNMTG